MKLKRTLAAIIAVTTLAVGGLTASAAINWKTTTSGNKTTYTGTSDTSIAGNNASYTASQMSATFTHTSGANSTPVWVATAINNSGGTKYMSASTMLYDEENDGYIYSASQYNSGDTVNHNARTASSNYTGTLPTKYTLEYDTYIAGGTSQYAGIVEEIDFRETIG